MILNSPRLERAQLAAAGWDLKPEGACRGGLCIRLPEPAADGWDPVEVANRLRMPIVSEDAAGLWALGPSAGPVLESELAPDFTLPDWRGGSFTLSGLRGRKAFLLAWAPW